MDRAPASPRNPPSAMLAAHYDEFRRIARAVLYADDVGQHLQPTELAHEAALRLIKLQRIDLKGRTHFLSLAARVMRQVLVDEARKFRAAKRQAPPILTQWNDEGGVVDLEHLDLALTRLEAIDPSKASIIEQRVFAGLTVEEIAEVSGVSESTVKRQWRVARAWLVNELGRG